MPQASIASAFQEAELREAMHDRAECSLGEMMVTSPTDRHIPRRAVTVGISVDTDHSTSLPCRVLGTAALSMISLTSMRARMLRLSTQP